MFRIAVCSAALAATLLAAPHVAAFELAYLRASSEVPSIDVYRGQDGPERPAGILLAGDIVTADAATLQEEWIRVHGQRGESSIGWVERYLFERIFPVEDELGIPVAGICGGVEPFWSVQWEGDQAVFDLAGVLNVTLTIDTFRLSDPPQLVLEGIGDGVRLNLLYQDNDRCTAGALRHSIRLGGVLVHGDNEAAQDVLFGCCAASAAAFP